MYWNGPSLICVYGVVVLLSFFLCGIPVNHYAFAPHETCQCNMQMSSAFAVNQQSPVYVYCFERDLVGSFYSLKDNGRMIGNTRVKRKGF